MSTRADALQVLFGDYRSESREGDLGGLFVRPPYFSKLVGQRPAFLIGGRGTGKTTALKSLRFDSHAGPGQDLRENALGLYIRANKNSVHALRNGGRSTDVWSRVFAHYFNLLAAIEFLRVCRSRQAPGSVGIIKPGDAGQLASTFGLSASYSADDLQVELDAALTRLELYTNNASILEAPLLSAPEAPLRVIGQIAGGAQRTVYCCIDEYENLLDYQQGVLNTYIKHAEAPLTYKIGVKRFGLRNRETSDAADLLMEPDDYRAIDIFAEPFESFATEVAQRRLAEAVRQQLLEPPLERVWPSLAWREEAVALGADRVAEAAMELLGGETELVDWAHERGRAEVYFAQYWSEAYGSPLPQVIGEAIADPVAWQHRLNNHGYASLFSLSRGRRGARIRKYYCGLPTYLQLAGGNIRYFLELLDVSLQLELMADTGVSDLYVRPDVQTLAAQEVGKRRLEQLEGLSEHGMKLKRLVLALGKVFFELARSPEGRTPEVTHFVLSGSPEDKGVVEAFLREGVSHQVFEVAPRTKATSDLEMRDDEYRLHPIFSPYFEFSYRRKRRITIDAGDLLLVQSNPRRAVANMLRARVETAPDEWPDQLSLFSSFYEAGAGESDG